ncbi:adenosine monophosphate deaminase, partial [Strigomonas culicis]
MGSQGRSQLSALPSSSSIAAAMRRPSQQRVDLSSRGSLALQRHRVSKGLALPPAASYHTAVNTYYTLDIDGDDGGTSMAASHDLIQHALGLRDAYKQIDKGQLESGDRIIPPIGLRLEDGVFHFSGQRTTAVPWEQFYEDVHAVAACLQNTKCQTACRQRLEILEERFNIYKIMNRELEENAGRSRQGTGVFADSVKVDNLVLMPYYMHSQHLTRFIRDTLATRGDDVVALQGDGADREPITLARACELLEVPDPAWLTGEALGLQPSVEQRRGMTRVDVLDPQFNSGGLRSAALLRLFLSMDTLNKGAYFADLIRPLLGRNEARDDTPQATETAIDLHGLFGDEWEKLALWLQEHGMLGAFEANRWLAYLRRPHPPHAGGGGGGDLGSGNNSSGSGSQAGALFSKLTTTATLENQQQQLENFFLPLLVATIAPEDPKNAHVANMLSSLGGIVVNCGEVNTEISKEVSRKRRRPVDVPWTESVTDMYFLYYVWANLTSLNALRRRRGFNTLQLRAVLPAGTSRTTLAVAYLLCDHVIDGCALHERPVLQYLFGIHRIGVSMAPLSTNGLGSVSFADHPFMQLFRRGLRVSLSTVTPLLTHCSQEPLLEEYSAASRMHRLSGVDLCELALNSVMMSTFPEATRQNWLGAAFVRDGWQGNNFDLTHVPTARLELRATMWAAERQVLQRCAELVAQAAAEPGDDDDSPSTVDNSDNNVTSGDPAAASVAAVSRGGAVRAPYVVVDPHTYFPRLSFVGPYERDMQNGSIVQLLHR